MTDRVGQQLGNYRLLRPLGEGGFAEVYLCEHIYLQRTQAIKILKTQMVQEEREAFLREAQTIAHLDHPHIVQVLDFGVQENIPYLVMSYAPNGSLRSRLPAHPLPIHDVLPFIQHIASALQYAHDHQIIHRDVKPDNMLIGQHDEILLSDFGIALVASSTGLQRTQDSTGTPAYMAPEQFQGKPRPASDQYALAITVYEWLCGRRPFDGDAHALGYQHVHTPPRPLGELAPTIPIVIEQIILKALAKNPQDRYETVTAFAAALHSAASQGISNRASVHEAPLIIHGDVDEIHRAVTEGSVPNAAKYVASTPSQQPECFVCTYISKMVRHEKHAPCVEAHIQGRILLAQERLMDGKPTPCITLNMGTKLATIALPIDYYRSFVRELIARGTAVRGLTLHVYHLPTQPTIAEYKGKPLYQYIGNSYTLAVLEPDILLNITDLSQADYCRRKYILGRLVSSPPSIATIRGNLIHQCFTGLLKANDRSAHPEGAEYTEERTPLETLLERLEQALALSTMDMALANTSADTMRADVMPHLESLATWYQNNRISLWGSDSSVRAETLLLVPEIGLRGRLDLYWQQSVAQSLLELKTGGTSGELPKSDHRKQVQGYQALLAVRQDSKLNKAKAKLLYSGTPGQASNFELTFSVREFQRTNETRNILVLSHITGTPPPPPGASRCTKCSMLNHCERTSFLLNWEPPATEIAMNAQQMNGGGAVRTPNLPVVQRPKRIDNEDDQKFFAYYYRLLQLEGKAGEEELARLWKLSVQDRVTQGKAIDGLEVKYKAEQEKDGWRQEFTCNNQSELREGDEILLSNGDPITREVVTGTITDISAKSVTVWTRERIDHPTLIDRYDNDLVHVRTLQNLLRWLDAEPHLRDLVAGRVHPRFLGIDASPRKDFNPQQNEAVIRAMQMQDYMLIQGPPGTGKTSVIAEIVKRLIQQGQRVMLAAFTNQAVDNMLKRLKEKEDFDTFLRIGSERSVAPEIAPYLLKKRVMERMKGGIYHVEEMEYEEDEEDEDREDEDNDEGKAPSRSRNVVYDLLQAFPVVASTTATWSSDKYTPHTLENATGASLSFDVAIIDEASQLTVPAVLGALRFAKRFILVGDEMQLPPLVLSEEAAEAGLSKSLFSILSHSNREYEKKQVDSPVKISASVSLETQYRMNQWICNFSSTVFYDKKLVPAREIANRKLNFSGKRDIESENPVVAQVVIPDFPLVFLDVRGEPDKGILKTSDGEAHAVREIVKGLLARGIKAGDIGVIAPYRAQVATIRRYLFGSDRTSGWQGLPTDSELRVDTVDRFQGGEKSVIIMSFATTSEPQGERRDFLINPNRLNVALTRAQHKLILVGCVTALEKLPIFERLINYCRSMKTVCTWTDVVP